MSVKVTYFVHGTTYDNLEHKASGWSQVALSPKGIEQSFNVSKEIDHSKFDVAFCSDLKRAIDSAHNIFGKDDIKIYIDERLRECNYGDLSGQDNKLVKYADHINEPFPNGESMQDIEVRIKSFCDEVLEKFDGKHIAIVAHKAPQLALEVLTNGVTWEYAIEHDWRTTGDFKAGWDYTIEKK